MNRGSDRGRGWGQEAVMVDMVSRHLWTHPDKGMLGYVLGTTTGTLFHQGYQYRIGYMEYQERSLPYSCHVILKCHG